MSTIDPAAVDALLARARREIDAGLLPSCQVAWADPATGLSFAYLTDGRDLHFLREHRRTSALGSLAARCATAG